MGSKVKIKPRAYDARGRVLSNFERRHRIAYPERSVPHDERALELLLRITGNDPAEVNRRVDLAFESERAVQVGVTLALVYGRWDHLGRGRAA